MDRFKHSQHRLGKPKPPRQVIKQIVLENKKLECCNKDNCECKEDEIIVECKKDL